MSDELDLIRHVSRMPCGCSGGGMEHRCAVAPSPELRERLQKALEKLRADGAALGVSGSLLRLRQRDQVGLNDGMIYPQQDFPDGTPLGLVRSARAQRAPLRGQVRVVVVLVDFSDDGFTAAHTRQHYDDLFFSTGVIGTGSVAEYFDDVSNGLVQITGEVVGPYRMPKKRKEYANGDSGLGGTAPNARTLADDALAAADADVDFDPYDNDGDGFVDAFIVVQAGAGAESTGSVDHIWSHKWVLPGQRSVDNTKVYAYLMVPEECRLGVCAHELGHLLFGWPDLYDTDYSSEGVGRWCLMGGGSWNNGGLTPAHPSAWCKADQGWVSVVNVTSNGVRTIQDVKASNEVLRLWKNGGSGSEYFLVENRQQAGFDQHLPGGGLLIWHIDDSVSSNSNEAHPKVALEQADGADDLGGGANRGDAGDPWPGSAGATTFDKSSTPGSRSYAGADTCVAVKNISASGPSMTADLRVRCGVVIDRKVLKDFKDARKETMKEGKEFIKEKELKDGKEIAKEKEKEWKEKEWKEIREKGVLDDKRPEKPEIDKLEAYDKPPLTEGGGGFDWPGRPGGGGFAPGTPAATPFIHEGLRPDLRRSALSAEADAGELPGDQVLEGAGTKRLFDSKPSER